MPEHVLTRLYSTGGEKKKWFYLERQHNETKNLSWNRTAILLQLQNCHRFTVWMRPTKFSPGQKFQDEIFTSAQKCCCLNMWIYQVLLEILSLFLLQCTLFYRNIHKNKSLPISVFELAEPIWTLPAITQSTMVLPKWWELNFAKKSKDLKQGLTSEW